METTQKLLESLNYDEILKLSRKYRMVENQ